MLASRGAAGAGKSRRRRLCGGAARGWRGLLRGRYRLGQAAGRYHAGLLLGVSDTWKCVHLPTPTSFNLHHVHGMYASSIIMSTACMGNNNIVITELMRPYATIKHQSGDCRRYQD